ncbi:MAG TPA: hypothetical protein VLM78_10765, partial [Anaerolineales bacterium]|nr:hypothetical protein [Anaerolineales bacterium]
MSRRWRALFALLLVFSVTRAIPVVAIDPTPTSQVLAATPAALVVRWTSPDLTPARAAASIL